MFNKMQLYYLTYIFMVQDRAFTPDSYCCVGCCHFFYLTVKGKRGQWPKSSITCFQNSCSTPVENHCSAAINNDLNRTLNSLDSWNYLGWLEELSKKSYSFSHGNSGKDLFIFGNWKCSHQLVRTDTWRNNKFSGVCPLYAYILNLEFFLTEFL